MTNHLAPQALQGTNNQIINHDNNKSANSSNSSEETNSTLRKLSITKDSDFQLK